MGGSSDGGQITPQSMSEPDKADALIKMLLFGVPTTPGGAGAASAASAGANIGADIGAGSALAGAPGLDAFSASPVTSSSFDLMGTMFPKSQNPWSSTLGIQDPTMAGMFDTMQRIRNSPLHQGSVPGEGEPLQMPQVGGVTLPKKRTSGRLF